MTDAPARPLLRVTPTAAGKYLDCPRAYRHKYLDRPAPSRSGGPWAHLDVGNAGHLALAAWWDLPDGQRTPEAARALVQLNWTARAFRDDAHAAAWLERVTGWVRAYLEQLDPHARPRGIERTVATVEQGMRLEGRADRIDQRGARLVVVDYKTGKNAPTEQDAAASPALAVYVLAAGRMLRTRCDRAELHHLPTGTVVAVDYDRDRVMRQISRLAELAREIDERATDAAAEPDSRDDIFPTTPGPLCRSCDFRAACPAGRDVEPAKPWDYLGDG